MPEETQQQDDPKNDQRVRNSSRSKGVGTHGRKWKVMMTPRGAEVMKQKEED